MRKSTEATENARFWSKVDVRGADDCWPWIGQIEANPYHPKTRRGKFIVSRGYRKVRVFDAARHSYELRHGPIPPKMEVCHSCDNGICCNDRHHWLGTHAENMADMRAKGRGSKPPVHRGATHPQSKLTEEQVRAILRDPRPLRRIAVDYGVSDVAISHIKLRRNWPQIDVETTPLRNAYRKPPRHPGADNNKSKLSEADVRAIRLDTRRSRDIARAYGVHYVTIWKIRRRLLWRHVD